MRVHSTKCYRPRLQRPEFEKDVVEVLKRPDIVNIEEYYNRYPSSGLWILEYGDKFVGLVAVDASPESLSNNTVLRKEPEKSKKTTVKAKHQEERTSATATIRHLYVSYPYRSAGAQDDLISFAVDHCFGSSEIVQNIRATPSPLSTYIGRALAQANFNVILRGDKVGLFKWPSLVYELTRETWKAKQQ